LVKVDGKLKGYGVTGKVQPSAASYQPPGKNMSREKEG